MEHLGRVLMERLAPILEHQGPPAAGCQQAGRGRAASSSSSSRPPSCSPLQSNPFLRVPFGKPWQYMEKKKQAPPKHQGPYTLKKKAPHLPDPPRGCMLFDRDRVAAALEEAPGCFWWDKDKQQPYLKVLCGLTSSADGKKEQVYESAHRLVCLAVHGPPLSLQQQVVERKEGEEDEEEGGSTIRSSAVAGWGEFPYCMHLCGNAQCLNPMHLAWATPAENHHAHTCSEDYCKVEQRRTRWQDLWLHWRSQQALWEQMGGMQLL